MIGSQKYKSPQSFKQALEHRIREQSSVAEMSMNRFRQVLVFERFLARVFSLLGTRVILKGGMVLELRLERARSTKDLDFRVSGSPDSFLTDLQKAGRLVLADYMTFECQEDPKHPKIEGDGVVYEGRRFRIQGFLAGKTYGFPFGVDASFGDALHTPAEELQGTNFFDFAGLEIPHFRVYPIASHIAEKLHAYTLPRKTENSRVKDLPDIALLAGNKALKSTNIWAAIETTFSSRKTHEIPSSLPKPPASWKPIYEKMAKEEKMPWKSLDDVFTAASGFLDPILSKQEVSWDPEQWLWEND